MAIIQKSLIGIDIDGKRIKLAQMNSGGKVIRTAYVDMPDGVVNNGRIESRQMLIESLKLARQKLNTSQKNCVLCLNSPEMLVRQMLVPAMEEQFIYNNITLEFASYLPISADKYIIDYIVTEEIDGPTKMLQLLVFAISRDVVTPYISCLKEAGFTVKYVDVIENAYEKLHRKLKNMNITSAVNFACLYVDNVKTSVILYNHGKFFINKNIDNDLEKICKDISDKTSRPIENVRNMIFVNNILENAEIYATEKNIIEKYVKYLSRDVDRVIDYFKSRFKGEHIDVVYLTGGLSHIKDIDSHLKSVLGIPVIPVNTLINGMFKEAPGTNNGVDYTNAIAVTLREEARE